MRKHGTEETARDEQDRTTHDDERKEPFMPASNEIASNRPLSGTELREIMIKDLGAMLDKDGMFSNHIAYGRAGYEIIVKLHVDNPLYPSHTVKLTSKLPARDETNHVPLALAPPPLSNPTDEAVVAAAKRERVIDSPNLARLEHGLPVTIMRRDGTTGEMKEEQVLYDNQDIEPGIVKDTDISDHTQAEWEL